MASSRTPGRCQIAQGGAGGIAQLPRALPARRHRGRSPVRQAVDLHLAIAIEIENPGTARQAGDAAPVVPLVEEIAGVLQSEQVGMEHGRSHGPAPGHRGYLLPSASQAPGPSSARAGLSLRSTMASGLGNSPSASRTTGSSSWDLATARSPRTREFLFYPQPRKPIGKSGSEGFPP